MRIHEGFVFDIYKVIKYEFWKYNIGTSLGAAGVVLGFLRFG